jgi:hypothetical protein
MSDALESKVGHCEEECAELQKCLDEEHDRLDTHSDAIDRVTRWALEGNGASAEARLSVVESDVMILRDTNAGHRLNCAEADIQALQKIADGKLSAAVGESVKTAMDARDRTVIAYVKAFAPYAAAAAGILIAVFK